MNQVNHPAEFQIQIADREAMFITDPSNIRYLSGFSGSDTNARDAYLLAYGNLLYLFTNSLYLGQAQRLSRLKHNLRVVRISRTDTVYEIIGRIPDFHKCKLLYFEAESLTYAEYLELIRNTGCEVAADSGRIESIREIKTSREVSLIRKAAQITDRSFRAVVSHIRPGVTEGYLSHIIYSVMQEYGMQPAFGTIVAAGINSSEPHYVSQGSGSVIHSGPVLFDLGARYRGYCADMSRMVFLGSPPASFMRVYDTVLAAQKTALGALGSGVRSGAELDSLAREYIIRQKLPAFTHSLGHCIGLDIHENPRLTEKKDALLKPGMVFSVEPGIYMRNKYGVRIEDLVYLTQKGPDILSKFTRKLVVV